MMLIAKTNISNSSLVTINHHSQSITKKEKPLFKLSITALTSTITLTNNKDDNITCIQSIINSKLKGV